MTTETSPLLSEKTMRFSDVIDACPAIAGLHPATLIRWHRKGTEAGDGRKVKLEALKVGCYYRTSVAAILRYLEAINSTPATDATPAPPRSPAQRRSASAAAAEKLAAKGL